MSTKICLNFDKTLVALAGNPFGQNIFNEQVLKKINDDDDVVIEFPPQIIRIASSFVQGFMNYWMNKYGIQEILKKVTIVTGNDKLTQSFYDNML